MKLLYRPIAILFLLGLFSKTSAKKVDYEESKTIQQEYTNVGSDVEIRLKNKYGRIEITTWNENRVLIEIEVTVIHSSEKKAKEELKNVTAEFIKNDQFIEAKTNFMGKQNSISFGPSKKMEKKIVFRVKMPKSNNLFVVNKFGDISLNELNGKAIIDLSYGGLTVGKLNHAQNKVILRFAKNSTISYWQGGKISAQYSGLTIIEAIDLDLGSQFSHVDLETVGKAYITSKYDKLTLLECDELKMDGQFSTIKIDKLKTRASVTNHYGYLRISNISADCKEVRLSNKFGKIRLGFAGPPSVEIYANVSFGEMDYPNSWDITEVKDQHNRTYRGNLNGGKIQVSITAQYGSIVLSEY